jgi:hypothetical protein
VICANWVEIYLGGQKNSNHMKLIFIYSLLSYNVCIGQPSIEKLISRLDNSTINYELHLISAEKNKDVYILPKGFISIKSLNLKKMIRRFGHQKVIDRLITCLGDSSKDWSANLILYSITQKNAYSLIYIKNREDWVHAQKSYDSIYWRNYHYSSQLSVGVPRIKECE